jgi:hypothetical protein
MIYLASPYSHDDPGIRAERFRLACIAAGNLMRDGQHVFSPIAHTHPIARTGLPGGWDFWAEFDKWFISRCDKVMVLKLEGWRESDGVRAEVALARRFGKPVEYVDPPAGLLDDPDDEEAEAEETAERTDRPKG